MTDTVRVCTTALDAAAEIMRAVLNMEIQRSPIGPVEPNEDEPASDVKTVVALTEGTGNQLDYCMGALRPYEFEHAGILEVLCIGGNDEARRAKRDQVIFQIAALVQANTSLNGVVDFAELVEPDPSLEQHYAAYAATLQLTYTALNALG